MCRKLEDKKAWEDRLQAYTQTIRFRFPQVQHHILRKKQCDYSSQNKEKRATKLLLLNRRKRLSELPLWRGSAVSAIHLALLFKVWEAKGDHVENTVQNGPENSIKIVGISQTGNTISHQYKITLIIFLRKPNLNKRRHPHH